MEDVSGLPYHRKYRPNTLIKYIGNSKLKDTAMKTLASGMRPQVIRMEGSSGCGKTTFARLLAKEYSCYNRDPETGACGVCDSCVAMDEYILTGSTDVLMNVHETNIADKNGVRDLDDIFEDISIPVYGDEWKIYIFDECHKATNALQNRFLKVVEEPPKNVLFIFCTTNPEEMLDTLKNRCTIVMKVEKPTVKELAGLLKMVCSTEDVEYDMKGLEFLANRADLTIRTALQNLWQVVSEQGSGKYSSIIKVFDEISNTLMLNFFRALKAKDVLRYVTLLCEAKERMALEVFFEELKKFTLRGIYTINGIQQDGISDGELKAYRDLFGDLGVAQISSFLSRILSFNVRNLELELLMLGYSGIVVDSGIQNSNNEKVIIESLDNELKKESEMTNQIMQEKADRLYEEGVENAKKSMAPVGIDALLSMGGMLVE